MRAPSFLLLLLTLVACGPSARAPAQRPYPEPTAAAVLAAWQHRTDGLLALRAQARAEYLDNGQRVKVTIAAVAARPDRLRLAGESALTGPLLTLASDGRRFQLLDVQQNRFLDGEATPCNVARLIRVELPVRDVVAVLFGAVGVLPNPKDVRLTWDPRPDKAPELLQLRDADGYTQRLRLRAVPTPGAAAPLSYDLEEAELLDPAEKTLWRVQHQDFAEVGPRLRLPGTTYIEDPPHHADVRLRWRERELNPSLPDGTFQLAAPPGVPREEAVCGGGI